MGVGIIPTMRNQDLPAWQEGTAAPLADVTGTDTASETQPLTASQETQESDQKQLKKIKYLTVEPGITTIHGRLKKIWTVLQRLIPLLMQTQQLVQDMPTQWMSPGN